MEINNLIIIFIIGFLSGAVSIILLYFIINLRKENANNKEEDLNSLKNHMQSIQQSLQNFNLAQDRIENTLIRGGAQQQGAWGEFVLNNILDSILEDDNSNNQPVQVIIDDAMTYLIKMLHD